MTTDVIPTVPGTGIPFPIFFLAIGLGLVVFAAAMFLRARKKRLQREAEWVALGGDDKLSGSAKRSSGE